MDRKRAQVAGAPRGVQPGEPDKEGDPLRFPTPRDPNPQARFTCSPRVRRKARSTGLLVSRREQGRSFIRVAVSPAERVRTSRDPRSVFPGLGLPLRGHRWPFSSLPPQASLTLPHLWPYPTVQLVFPSGVPRCPNPSPEHRRVPCLALSPRGA